MSLIELSRGDITTATAEAVVTSVSPKLTVSDWRQRCDPSDRRRHARRDAPHSRARRGWGGIRDACWGARRDQRDPRRDAEVERRSQRRACAPDADPRGDPSERRGSGGPLYRDPKPGSGANGVPVDVAAAVALKAASDFLDSSPEGPRKIEYWLDSESTYATALERLSTRHRKVTRADYWFDRLEEEPTSATRPLAYERRVDPLEAEFIAAGQIAQEMEKKWFGYETDARVNCYGSWTGYEVFSFRLRPIERGAMVDQAHVCSDEARNKADDAEAREQLDDLISWLASGTAYG